jgi:uracil-DNA glycosylase
MEWHFHLPAIKSIKLLDQKIVACRKCPRLVQWREEVAVVKRKSYENEKYWGKPVPGFGPADARIVIVGLAPGAHGANRTGRIFTGDSSGDWLYKALHKNGLATIPTSTSADDGQKLIDTRITCAVRCAPPDNKPSTEEKIECSDYLINELELLDANCTHICCLRQLCLERSNQNSSHIRPPHTNANSKVWPWRKF